MEGKNIEIPFGAFDSELGGFEYTIPEGYEAEIKEGKVVVKKKESEDERIRKDIISLIKETHVTDRYYDLNKMLAWLEKQGEQKPVPDWMLKFLDELRSKKNYFDWDEHKDIEGGILAIINWMNPDYFNEKDGEQKPADKVEPKFKVGDWVVFNEHHNSVYQVERIDNYRYYLRHYLGGTLSVHFDDELIRHWTIEDARDGDVLSYRDGQCIFIFKKNRKEHEIAYHALISDRGLSVNDVAFTIFEDAIDPATKEQRDTLFKAMCEAGYKWNADEKKLKKIEKKPQRIVSAEAKEAMYDKAAWSEKDENWLFNAINVCELNNYNETADWLKSLKDRIQPKQEWSEEDEENRIDAIKYLELFDAQGIHGNVVTPCINWLKSLRPQNTWKPSDEQMDALQYVYRNIIPPLSDKLGWNSLKTLELMYQDLKKLKRIRL